MKRSRHLTLSIMAAGAVLSGCSDNSVTHAVAESSDDCKLNDFATPEACERAFDQAFFAHQRQAPVFPGRESCQEQFGYCSPVADEAGVLGWRPVMAGYLMSYAPAKVGDVDCNADPRNDQCRAHDGGAGAGRVVITSAPLYREFGSGQYFTANNQVAGYTSGLLRGGPTARAPTHASTASRGGFGRRSGIFGG
mgnify:CR=1 FL=1